MYRIYILFKLQQTVSQYKKYASHLTNDRSKNIMMVEWNIVLFELNKATKILIPVKSNNSIRQ